MIGKKRKDMIKSLQNWVEKAQRQTFYQPVVTEEGFQTDITGSLTSERFPKVNQL